MNSERTIPIDQSVLDQIAAAELSPGLFRFPRLVNRELASYGDGTRQALRTVLRSLGGKKVQGQNEFHFEQCVYSLHREVLSTGSMRRDVEYSECFPTPDPIADQIVKLAIRHLPDSRYEVVSTMEPSCGLGALVRSLVRHGFRNIVTVEKKSHDLSRFLRSHPLTVRFPISLRPRDFLTTRQHDHPDRYQLIVMCPPRQNLRDMRHVWHALQFLRPGGILIAIMNPGWRTRDRSDCQTFAKRLAAFSTQWVPLPEDAIPSIEGDCLLSGLLLVKNCQSP